MFVLIKGVRKIHINIIETLSQKFANGKKFSGSGFVYISHVLLPTYFSRSTADEKTTTNIFSILFSIVVLLSTLKIIKNAQN